MLTNVQSAPDLYVPPENEIRGYFNATKTNSYREAVLEIQAYDNQIVLIGQSIGNPHYWPAGHKVWQEKLLEITAQAIGWRTIWKGDDIVLPSEISDDELGKHIQRMWLARMRTSYPPPEELEDFWQGIKD